jgi:hypothetical protein
MKIQGGSIVFENGFTITLHRTIRLPEDGNSHALPPSRGRFPMKRIEDYRDRVPEAWREHGGVFIPMYEREAMWLGFSGRTSAVKIATGKINAVSGGKWTQELQPPTGVDGKDPEQDYMVAPNPQPWLDGFNIGGGQIRQFVAMQMGKGYTVEGQVTGKEDVGGIQVLVIPSKPGALPAPRRNYSFASMSSGTDECVESACSSFEVLGATERRTTNSTRALSFKSKKAEMGLAQGGRMQQTISADPHGIDTWDQSKAERVFIHIVDATLWKEITGEECPPSPISASEYKGAWFTYDNGKPAVQGSGTLANVKPVSQKDKEHGFEGQQDDSTLNEEKTNPVVALGVKVPKNVVTDGKW